MPIEKFVEFGKKIWCIEEDDFNKPEDIKDEEKVKERALKIYNEESDMEDLMMQKHNIVDVRDTYQREEKKIKISIENTNQNDDEVIKISIPKEDDYDFSLEKTDKILKDSLEYLKETESILKVDKEKGEKRLDNLSNNLILTGVEIKKRNI